MTQRGTCTVGLTGGVASGKSSVAKLLCGRGVPVLDADAVVHRLYEPGRPGAVAVSELFGAQVMTPQGSVDRMKLGARVMSDAQARRRLNEAVHPLVRAEIARWLTAVGDAIAVVEAALLVETGGYRSYDLLMVVWCHREQQLARAIARGVAAEVAGALLEAQAPIADKVSVADVVIDNSGRQENLTCEVESAWCEVVRRCREQWATSVRQPEE